MIKLKNILFLTGDQRSSNNIGYHRGDGGVASDTTFKRMDAGRSTGHFGTGIYFCGAPEKITGRSDRPLLKLDLSNLNLAKPDDPIKLHNALREFNRLVYRQEPLEWGQSRFYAESIKFTLRIELGFAKFSDDDIKQAIIKIYNLFKNKQNDNFKSPSTYLMQELGYDGIDARFTEADNTYYGSVIYPNAKVKIV